MEMYQHDNAKTFRFVLKGELNGDAVRELGYAWETARSVTTGKDLLVDLSGLTSASPDGVALLVHMRDSGAHLTATLPPESEDMLRSAGIPAAVSRPPRRRVRNPLLLLFALL